MGLPEISTQHQTTGHTIIDSFTSAVHHDQPYSHWFATNCLPVKLASESLTLPFDAPDLMDVSGRREIHNKTRNYFDQNALQNLSTCHEIAAAFQSKTVTDCIAAFFNVNLTGSYLRIEYAQDTDGFWLEPHTDLGVKLFTMLLYLSIEDQHETLGTDIYYEDMKHYGRSPFAPNSALIFIPADNTYHGFEKRPITGVRNSIIINYVTDEWRAREQLAFPENPVTSDNLF